jgi:hypothetical protein
MFLSSHNRGLCDDEKDKINTMIPQRTKFGKNVSWERKTKVEAKLEESV